MQRFYFDINDGRTRSFDTLGQELPTLDDARKAALQELTHLIRDELPDGDRENFVVTVLNEERTPVYIAILTLVAEKLIPN